MKKIAILAGSLMILSLVFSSCKSHERCPAYSQQPLKTAPQA
ncbi:MAG: hypothetical protein ACJASM_000083 [Salibacteraceae bacterium]|jgi:hypothetical protein